MARIRLAEVVAKPERVVAGLMTGTSMDGLDIVLVRVPAGIPRRFDVLASASEPYPADLRHALAPQGCLDVATAARLSRRLGEWYASATARLVASSGVVPDLIGVHGQTLHHEHGVATVQLGEPSFLALELGCPVVADFRAGDVAAGGCGAPLVPVVDLWLFGDTGRGLLCLNLGGIANVTAMLPEPLGAPRTVGFDTGPGNMVLDELARRFTDGALTYDCDGAMALAGRVRPDWLAWALRHPFLALAPPRSAGREDFGADWVSTLLAAARPVTVADRRDLMATAVELTARTVATSVSAHVAPLESFARCLVAGGGTRNPALMAALRRALAPAEVTTSDAAGVPGQLKEAIAFALLASARIDGITANLPTVTGADRAVLLGKIVEA